jgi:hypothetical protein
MNTGFQLNQLQQLDSAIADSSARIKEIERLIQNQGEVEKITQSIIQLESDLKQKQTNYDLLNHEIQSKKNKKSQSESSLYAGKIQNPKELQDLQLETSSLSQAIVKMEDELLEKMIELDEAQEEMKESQILLAKTKKEQDARNSKLIGEMKELERAVENNLLKKEPIISQIPENDLTLYQRLLKSKNGVAVGKLQDDSCSSCGASLTASQCQQARSPGSLFFCPNCGRIVYGS